MNLKTKHQSCRRLKIIAGQIRGLQKMIDDEIYCIDIINQSLAVKQALSSVEDLILENHLKTHIVEQIKSGRIDKAAKEVVSVLKLSRKK